MNTGRRIFYHLFLIIIGMTLSFKVLAFSCGSAGTTISMAAANVPKNTSGTALVSNSFATSCSGNATSAQLDAMRIQSVSVGTAFMNQNYVVEVSLGGSTTWQTPGSVTYACIWPGNNTSYNCSTASSTNSGSTRNIRIRIRRTSNAALTATIPTNTTIATIVAYQRSSGIWSGSGGWAKITLTYRLSGEISAVVPTCEVKDFDNKVLLPTVKKTELISNGAGRYTKAKQPFSINLECKDSPKVDVIFTGTTMGSNNEVLLNQESGNPNVGIQLEYVDNYSTAKTTVKNGTVFRVLQSGAANETLNFNSYYYYKGGGSAVNGGLVKSNAEFLLTYQ